MPMAQFVSVLDVSDAESDSRDKTRVWSNVTVWFLFAETLSGIFCEFVLDFVLLAVEAVGAVVSRKGC
jgi:hypothetical protein